MMTPAKARELAHDLMRSYDPENCLFSKKGYNTIRIYLDAYELPNEIWIHMHGGNVLEAQALIVGALLRKHGEENGEEI